MKQGNKIKLFIFDMDGVIFHEHNFWLDLHLDYKMPIETLLYYKKNKNLDYKGTFQFMVNKYWKGLSATKYFNLINQREYSIGIINFFNKLHRYNIQTAIVSSGPIHLAKRAQNDLGINFIFANEMVIKNNRFTGEVNLKVNDSKKTKIGYYLRRKLNLIPSNIAFVGDSDADIGLAKYSKLSFAYNTKSQGLIDSSDYTIELGKIEEISTKYLQMNSE